MAVVALQFNAIHSNDHGVAELPAALEEAGYSVEVQPYLGSSLDWHLAVHLGELLEAHVLDALVALLMVRLERWAAEARNRRQPDV